AFVERYAASNTWWQQAWAYPCTSTNCYDSANYPILWNNQGAQTPSVETGKTVAAVNQYALSSTHTGITQTALLDGSVRSISTGVSKATLTLALSPTDGGVMPSDW